MLFDLERAERWRLARDCRRWGGRRCYRCDLILEDFEAVAEHLIAVRHGYGGCFECTVPGGDRKRACLEPTPTEYATTSRRRRQ